MTAREPDPPSAKPLLDKLGIAAGMRVTVLGIDDPEFASALAGRGADVARGRIRSGSDAVFLNITRHADLTRLSRLRRSLEPAGAIWAVWPKGRRELTENHVRAAALAQDLVDVKVVAFSPTLSALKLVIPVARRTPAAARRLDRAKSSRKPRRPEESL